MRTDLVCEIRPRLDGITPQQWRHLFAGLLDQSEMISHIQQCGLDGFTFHSIVVRQQGRPILLWPLFEADDPLSTFVNPVVRRIIDRLVEHFPSLFRPRLLGVSSTEGEWGQVGVDPDAPREILDAAWNLALEALRALAAGLRADVIAFVNFTMDSGRSIPVHKLRGDASLSGLPSGHVPVPYRSLDE